MTTPKALKTIPSHAGHARFLAEFDVDAEGDPLVVRAIPRPGNIPSPYRYSPDWPVHSWKGREVIIAETSHRRYQVFAAADALPAAPIGWIHDPE